MPHTPHQLIAKYSLRSHFLGLLVVVSLSGAGLDRLFLALGWRDLVARTAVSFCASYALFFLFARMWLHVLASDSRLLHDVSEKEDEPDVVAALKPKKSLGWFDWLGWWVPLDGEFAVLFFALIALVILIFGTVWMVSEGPVILVDVAFDLALAGGLVRGLQCGPGEGWASVLFRRSIVPFLVLLVMNLIAVQIAHVSCPGNDRLSTMVQNCIKPANIR